MSQYEFAVVGRGLMGAAAARHLAEQVPGVVLIGPDEHENAAAHSGVFASHYDEGRITRTIDPDQTWARLANRSIGRYRDIEARSGLEFFSEKGCLIAGLTTGRSQQYMADVRVAAEALGAEWQSLDNAALEERFGYFSFPKGSDAVFEPARAGHISPRRLVAAQTRLCEIAGGTVIRDYATRIMSGEGSAAITLSDGSVVTAAKVLVAAGGFTNLPGLLPEALDLKVFGRTISFFEVDAAEAARLADMPSLIYEPEEIMAGAYMLPPILYPDGRHYLKIGGDQVDVPMADHQAVLDWFKTSGHPSNHERLVETMVALVPSLRVKAITSGSCVTSFTPTGYPAIGWTSAETIAVMAGGCGAAAKSSDEIGRLGAELLVHGRIIDQAYRADFEPVFL